MAQDCLINGWVEEDGSLLPDDEIRRAILHEPDRVCRFGGEFAITCGRYRLRDHLGIFPGDAPPGIFEKDASPICRIDPNPPLMPLADAIQTAVRLRSSVHSVVALSGGVDSALIARLAGRPCIGTGLPGSHDLLRGRAVAERLGCQFTAIEIDPGEVEDVLIRILPHLPSRSPVDAGIAATLFFLCRAAAEMGYDRILSGQGADELFCGYTRHLQSLDLAADRAGDLADLPRQLARDQAVAGISGVWLSMPYLDLRVLRAADHLPVNDMIQSGVRKYPLRLVASAHMPEDIAWYEKKAMQYGSGVWKTIQARAQERGFKRAVQGYMNHLQEGGAEDGL
ncbi:MAG: asparagine synthase [Methanocalculus sp. MSAO_Arc1]|nr:MAG: asparagine synthase [Methanocalculus sp. MSAO_Arc1]